MIFSLKFLSLSKKSVSILQDFFERLIIFTKCIIKLFILRFFQVLLLAHQRFEKHLLIPEKGFIYSL